MGEYLELIRHHEIITPGMTAFLATPWRNFRRDLRFLTFSFFISLEIYRNAKIVQSALFAPKLQVAKPIPLAGKTRLNIRRRMSNGPCFVNLIQVEFERYCRTRRGRKSLEMVFARKEPDR